jgi:Uma2 family endonuclease
MPVTLTDPPLVAESPHHKLWTRDECDRVQSAGVPLRHYELIEGELVQKVSKNHPHMLSLAALMAWLTSVFGAMCVLQEPTIDVAPQDNPTSAPEPDAVVLTKSIREIRTPAVPSQMRLVVEISDFSLAFDLKTKAALYARAGIVEYWVLDINKRLIVHRDPQHGAYQSVLAYREDELVSCLAAPDRQILVSDLL